MGVEHLTDAEVAEIHEQAATRLREHVEHKLGADPGCGQCLYCVTCSDRVCSYDIFGYLLDNGIVQHRRFNITNTTVVSAKFGLVPVTVSPLDPPDGDRYWKARLTAPVSPRLAMIKQAHGETVDDALDAIRAAIDRWGSRPAGKPSGLGGFEGLGGRPV